jgi:small subunit ribosomal protein S18
MSKSGDTSTVRSTAKNDKSTKKFFFKKRKGCPLSLPSSPPVDYKNPELLFKFVSEGGRILPSRITGVCASKQRELSKAIKIARHLALMPFVCHGK